MRERVEALGEQTSLADRKRRAGQRLLIGFAGEGVDDDLRYLVREIRPAGFVIYARNYLEPGQMLELTRELRSLSERAWPALISVDQEGGRIQELGPPATTWPAPREVGAAAQHTAEVASAIATELAAMGIDLNLAPVADVDTHPANPIIGDRAFGSEPGPVSAHVAAFVRAHQELGVGACAKHFPGHGDTELDSHLDLPVVEREEPELREVELAPFRAAVEAGVGAVMTAHVVYSAFDEELPATLSERVVPRLLRAELGFEGLVISDALEMKAIAGRWSPSQVVARATRAGVDLLLSSHDPKLQVAVFQDLVRLQEQDPIAEDSTRRAVERGVEWRLRFLRREQPSLDVVGSVGHRALAALVKARGAP